MLQLDDVQKKVMTDACAKAAPYEACGIIAGGRCIELPNHATSPGVFFLDAAEYGSAVEQAGGYEGIWHTHPSGNPLPSDDDWAYHPRSKALVVATRTQVGIYYATPES